MPQKIRVLVVDDSMFFRSMLTRELSANSDIEVVGEAFDPYVARDKILELKPDVMTLDVEMPNMDGVEFLKILLPQWKIPVITVSSLARARTAALSAGAFEFLKKPDAKDPTSVSHFSRELAKLIRAAVSKTLVDTKTFSSSKHIIVLGASTGGTQATTKIIKALPADTPGLVVVQHMPPDFTKMYAEGLDRDCAMSVAEAHDGDQIVQGQVLIAPGGNRQMEIIKGANGYHVRLRQGEKVSGHCPSVDVLFRSAAKIIPGRTTIGVILTGMGADGAKGLLAMRNTGSYTIGQDEKTSVVYGMPKEAYEMGAVVRQAPLESIAGLITNYAKGLKS